MRGNILPIFVLSVLFAGCTSNSKPAKNAEAGKTVDSKCQLLMDMRVRKNLAFANPENSPLGHNYNTFTGLKYYACDPKWSVVAKLESAKEPESKTIIDTKGQVRDYVLAGVLVFKIENADFRLKAYFNDASHESLFIMFHDLTNGKETYEGGRYMEVENVKSGNIALDFNLAYNPFCHYNHNFSCPVVPKDCQLDLAIQAGEKKYN